MKILTPKVMAILVAFSLIIGGCDKTTEPAGGAKPTFPTFQVSLPASPTGSNNCNDSAYMYAVQVQLLAQVASGLASLPLTNNGGAWTYTVTDQGVTETLTSTRQGDGSYAWTYVVNDGSGNWTAMQGTSSADGSTGSLTIYDDSAAPNQTIDIIVSWRQVASGKELTFDSYSSGQPQLRVVVLSNTNQSGEMTEYVRSGSQWVPTGFHATWSGPGATAICG